MSHIVILSGAGISAESGIQTFRDSNGLWENYAIEDVATPQAWKKDSELVQRFYNQRRRQVMEAEPNAAHLYFAALEKDHQVTIVTQNIDDLHERAGSTNVIHLHGNIRQAKSSGPDPDKKFYEIEGSDIEMGSLCEDGFQLRPHVVWFGEEVPEISRAADICKTADYLVIVGTSLQVYPAAGLAHIAPPDSVKFLIDPNCEALQVDSSFVKLPYSAVEGVKHLKF